MMYTRRLTRDQKDQIRARRAAGEPAKRLAEEYGVSRQTIHNHSDAPARAATPPHSTARCGRTIYHEGRSRVVRRHQEDDQSLDPRGAQSAVRGRQNRLLDPGSGPSGLPAASLTPAGSRSGANSHVGSRPVTAGKVSAQPPRTDVHSRRSRPPLSVSYGQPTSVPVG